MRSSASCALHHLQDRRTQADRCILRKARFAACLSSDQCGSPRSRHSHKDTPTTTFLYDKNPSVGKKHDGIATGVSTILDQLGLLAAEKKRRFTGIGPLRQPPWIS